MFLYYYFKKREIFCFFRKYSRPSPGSVKFYVQTILIWYWDIL